MNILLNLTPLFFNSVFGDFLHTKFQVPLKAQNGKDAYRPPWGNDITARFIVAHGHFFNQPNFAPLKFKSDLCHVYSWGAIRKTVNYYLERALTVAKPKDNIWNDAFNTLVSFIKRLFEIDPDAVVNYNYMLLGNNQPVAPLHDAYLKKGSLKNGKVNLESLNMNLLNEAITILGNIKTDLESSNPQNHDADVLELLTILFNAPANLRYGDFATNRALGDQLDIMGNNNQHYTKKEDQLFAIINYVEEAIGPNTRRPALTRDDTCIDIAGNRVNCIWSATGVYQNVAQNRWGIPI